MNTGVIAGTAILIILLILGGAALLKRRDGDPNTAAHLAGAGGASGTRKIVDRKSMWAKRYGAGSGAWTAAVWTAGAGFTLSKAEEDDRDHNASYRGSGGAVGDAAGCGASAACGGG